jgi:hypothetical protein
MTSSTGIEETLVEIAEAKHRIGIYEIFVKSSQGVWKSLFPCFNCYSVFDTVTDLFASI